MEVLLVDRFALRVVHIVVIIGEARNQHGHQPDPGPHYGQPCFQNRSERDESEDHGSDSAELAEGGYVLAKSMSVSCFIRCTNGWLTFVALAII